MNLLLSWVNCVKRKHNWGNKRYILTYTFFIIFPWKFDTSRPISIAKDFTFQRLAQTGKVGHLQIIQAQNIQNNCFLVPTLKLILSACIFVSNFDVIYKVWVLVKYSLLWPVSSAILALVKRCWALWPLSDCLQPDSKPERSLSCYVSKSGPYLELK